VVGLGRLVRVLVVDVRSGGELFVEDSPGLFTQLLVDLDPGKRKVLLTWDDMGI
jgi:hypothetical protein